MKIKFLSILFLILLILPGCENPSHSKSDNGRINLSLSFPENIQKIGGLQKTTNITHVIIIVRADDFDDIEESFEVSGSHVEVWIDVPKGERREFIVQGRDQDGRLQFAGSKTVNINNSDVDVIINNLDILAPDPVDVNVDNINEQGFEIHWGPSNAADFAFYRVLVSRTQILDPENHTVMNDITERGNTNATISGTDPDTDYYFAVLVADTELYFNGILEFGVPGSIVQIVHTASEGGSLAPVDIDVSNITSTTFDLFWSRSTIPDFNFYRVLLSNEPNLHTENHQLGNDMNNIDRNAFHIFNLEEFSIYYTTVLNVNSDGDFMGSLEYGAEYSIVKRVTTAEQILLSYDDETDDSYWYSGEANSRFMNKFSPPTDNSFVFGLWLALSDDSGQGGNYRVVICNENRDVVYLSDPRPTVDGADWVWQPIDWENTGNGFFNSDFYVGIEYTKTNEQPWVFFDENSDQGAGYYVDAAGTWTQLRDLGGYGNLMIQAVVDINGHSEKGRHDDSDTMILTPLNNSNMKIDPLPFKTKNTSFMEYNKITKMRGHNATK